MKPSASTLLVLAIISLAPACFAQTYPAKPVRLVVPYAAGGGADAIARLAQNRLAALLDQPVVVENRGGAGGAIGAEYVARAAPDGYTIMFTPGTDMLLRQFLSKNTRLDVVRDFTAIAVVADSFAVIAAKPSEPFATAAEFVEYARRNPGKLTFASPGMNSNFHLAGELLKMHGLDLVHVPFSSNGPSATALAAGQVDLMFGNLATALPLVRDGRAKAVALFDVKRYARLPNLAALPEVLPGFNLPSSWFGYFGPARLPAAVVARLNADINAAFASSEVRPRVEEQSMTVLNATPQEFAAMVREGVEIYGKIVRAAGIKPE
jgi:tripartite-type tricarboxylate transporter receptor subunit TctC